MANQEQAQVIDTHEVKDYLNQLRYIDNQIESRRKELDDIRGKGFLKASMIKENKVQESNTDMYDEKYMKIWDLPDLISGEIDEYLGIKKKIREQIHSLDDQLEVLVLRERYLNQTKWENIAVNQQQTVRNIQRIHGRALRCFGEKYINDIEEFKNKK